MSLADQKSNIFTTIGAYTSTMQAKNLPNPTSVFASVNNKKDIVPLLLDILKVVVGSDALQQLTGQIFTNLVPKLNTSLSTGVKQNAIQSNSGDALPSWFTNGLSVPVKNIDVNGTFKTNPNSATGNLLYTTNTPNFNITAYNAILNSGTDTLFGNSLIINYNSSTDAFIFKPSSPNITIGQFTNGFIDNMTLIDKKQFVTGAMNLFYGSVTSNQGKTVEQIAQELQVAQLIQQLMNDDDSFVILPQDYNDILNKARELFSGVTTYDLGCGVMKVYFPLSGMTNLVSNISGSTDPHYTGNQINNTIAQSTANNPNATANNKTTIQDGFFQKLINFIISTLAQAITTTPQIRTLLAITSAFSNNGISKIGNPVDDLKEFKVFLKCNLNLVMAAINKFIYELVIGFLISLITPVIKKIIREKINQYLKQLKSLIAPSVPTG